MTVNSREVYTTGVTYPREDKPGYATAAPQFGRTEYGLDRDKTRQSTLTFIKYMVQKEPEKLEDIYINPPIEVYAAYGIIAAQGVLNEVINRMELKRRGEIDRVGLVFCDIWATQISPNNPPQV